jgi:hypothetical protein
VMEIPTAYVREHAPRGRRVADQPPTPDIQAILTVIGRRIPDAERDEGRPIDLRTTDLQRANLSGANLQRANLSSANLQGAKFSRAYVQEANLARTRNLVPELIEQARGDKEPVGAVAPQRSEASALSPRLRVRGVKGPALLAPHDMG